MLTAWHDFLFKHHQCVAPTVLLFDQDLVAGVKPLIVQLQCAAEVVHGDLGHGLDLLLVLEGRLLSVNHQAALGWGKQIGIFSNWRYLDSD